MIIMDNINYIVLIFTAFLGFLLAFYIRHKKQAQKKLICLLNFDCDAVIYSKYSKFLGIPVEIIGLLYYGAIALSYGFFLFLPNLVSTTFIFVTFVFTVSAFFFSLYLTFIQMFTLRQLCTWCLTSTVLCIVILVNAISISGLGFILLLKQYHQIILISHIMAMALGRVY